MGSGTASNSGSGSLYSRLLEIKGHMELCGDYSSWNSLCDCMYLLINKLPLDTTTVSTTATGAVSASGLNHCCADLFALFSNIFKNQNKNQNPPNPDVVLSEVQWQLQLQSNVQLFLSVCKGLFIRPNCKVAAFTPTSNSGSASDSGGYMGTSTNWQDIYMNLIIQYYTTTNTNTNSIDSCIRACLSTHINTIIDIDMETYPITPSQHPSHSQPILIPLAVLRSVHHVFPMYKQKLWCKVGLTLLDTHSRSMQAQSGVGVDTDTGGIADCLLAVCTLATYVPSSVLTSTSSNNSNGEGGPNTLAMLMQCIVVSLQMGGNINTNTTTTATATALHSRSLSLLLTMLDAPLALTTTKTHAEADVDVDPEQVSERVCDVVRATSIHLHTLIPMLLKVSSANSLCIYTHSCTYTHH